MKHTTDKFTLDELCALTETPKRTVRYYIQIGLLDRPIGETKAAHYQTAHLDTLLRIRKFTQSGISLERIREILSGEDLPAPIRPRGAGAIEVWSHLAIADGVELQIEASRAGLSPEQVRKLFRGAMNLFEQIRQEK